MIHFCQEEIKTRLKSGNACCHSVQNLLSSSLLSKNLKINIYRTIILPFILYGCETWSLTLRVERRLRVFENRVLRRIFGPKRDEVTNGEDYIMRNLKFCTPHPILCGWQNREKWDGRACSKHGGEEKRIQGLVWKHEGTRPLENPTRRWEDNIKMDLMFIGPCIILIVE